MNTVTRIAVSPHAKITALAFALLALGALSSAPSFADGTNGVPKATESGTVSLAGIDVLTPTGVRIATFRIHELARRLCLQLVNLSDQDAATCVDHAVADAQQKLNAVIQARLAEREAQTLASGH